MGAGSPPHHAGRRRGVHSERTPKGRLGPGNDDVSSSGEAHRHGRAGGRDAKRTSLARPSMPWGRVSVPVLVACGLSLAGLFARRPPTCQMPPCVLGNYSCLRSVKKMPALWRLGAPDILPDRNRFAEGLKTHAPRGPKQAPIRGNRNWRDRELDN